MEKKKINISGVLNEQDSYSGQQPQLRGFITFNGKEFPIAGWLNFRSDGSLYITISDTYFNKKTEE